MHTGDDKADSYHEQLYSRRYKIGEFAAITGMNPSRIRFYEGEGLFESRREENGYRYYTAQDAFRANAFRALQRYGFSNEEAIAMLDARQDSEEFRRSLTQQREELERQAAQLQRRMERIDQSLAVLDLPPTGRFSLTDEPDWIYIADSDRSDFSLAIRNAKTIAVFFDLMSVTSCARIIAREDLEGDAPAIEPTYILAMPESDSSWLEGQDVSGVERFCLGKCLRYYRRVSRARSLQRESFVEMFAWLDAHGYRIRGDVLLLPQFLNLDGQGEDVEILLVPVA